MLDLWAEGVDLWAVVVDLSNGGAGGAGGGRRCWSSGRRPPSSASAPVSSWTPSSSTSSATLPRRLTTRPCSLVLPVVLVYFARSGSSTGSAAPTASEGSTTAMAVVRRRERDVEADLNLPPGFRFHPTDDELVEHYLCRQAAGQRLPVSIIAVRAYDPLLHVLAVATRNGQIKLFGRDNTQALLQSPIPSKFLRVWDIDTKKLCYLHPFEKQITMLTVLHKSFYM